MFKKIFTFVTLLVTLLVTITVGINSFGVTTKAQEYYSYSLPFIETDYDISSDYLGLEQEDTLFTPDYIQISQDDNIFYDYLIATGSTPSFTCTIEGWIPGGYLPNGEKVAGYWTMYSTINESCSSDLASSKLYSCRVLYPSCRAV